jgi:tetratricopeptide (TPR) repeat protein
MQKIRMIALALVAAAGFGAHADAQERPFRRSAGVIAIPAEDPADSLFRVARQAMNNGDYRRAANLLKQVTDKYPNAKPASDALYWRAWSLHRLGADNRSSRDLDDAMDALDRLESDYPKAATIADARGLRATIRSTQASLGNAQAAGDIARDAKGLRQQRGCNTGSAADEEMRMAALDGLLSMNSADAIPILQDVLKQTDPCKVEMRKKAIFLISQKSGNDVARTLLDVARTDPSNDVRGDAIFWLSQTRSDVAIPALDSILFQAKDNEIRKKAIFALSQKSRDPRARAALQKAAEDERFPEDLRAESIFWLGQGGIVDLAYFKSLFQKTKDVDLRKKITFSVSQHSSPEATAWLLDIAKDRSYDIDVRKDAIFWVSQRSRVDMSDIQSVYDSAKNDPEMQKQVIFVYSQRRESAAVDKLMEIAKSDPRLENRKDALFWLGQKNDPRVKQFLRDLINK